MVDAVSKKNMVDEQTAANELWDYCGEPWIREQLNRLLSSSRQSFNQDLMALVRRGSVSAAEKAPGHPKSMISLGQVSFPDPEPGTTYPSCKSVFPSAGGLLAVPLRPKVIRAQSAAAAPISTYRADYVNEPESSCGATNKPLHTYHPNAKRSRLPGDKFKPLDRNKSNVMIEVRDIKDPRQFWTTHRNYHRGAGGVQSSNLSIIANKTKNFHRFQHQG